jgi:hypothetical protein
VVQVQVAVAVTMQAAQVIRVVIHRLKAIMEERLLPLQVGVRLVVVVQPAVVVSVEQVAALLVVVAMVDITELSIMTAEVIRQVALLQLLQVEAGAVQEAVVARQPVLIMGEAVMVSLPIPLLLIRTLTLIVVTLILEAVQVEITKVNPVMVTIIGVRQEAMAW